MAVGELAPDPTAPTGTGPRGDSVIRPGVDYRQLEQPVEMRQPWHIPASGAVQEADALSAAFKDFSNKAEGVASKLNRQAGTDAGKAAGMDPGFQPLTGLAAVTNSGEAYNAAAHVSYVANTQTSLEDSLNQAEQANPKDPAAFSQAAAAIREQTLKQTPALYQPEIQTMIDRRIMAGQNRVQDFTTKSIQSDAEYAYTSTVDKRMQTAVRTAQELPQDQQASVIQQFVHDDQTMRDGLVTSGAWSQTRADAVALQVKDGLEKEVHANYARNIANGFMDTVRSGQVDQADKALTSYLKDPVNSDDDKKNVLQTFEEQRSMYTKLMADVHTKDIAAVGAQLIQGSGQLNGQGAYGPAIEKQINQMHNAGWITHETAVSMLDTAVRNSVKAADDDASNELFDKAMHGGGGLDPANKDIVKASDAYFNTHVLLQGQDYGSPVYATAALGFVQRTNIVPPDMLSKMRVGALSNDPDQVAYAARLSAQLKDANPRAAMFDDHDTKTTALLSLMNDNLNTGASNAQSFAMAKAQVDMPPAQKTQREEDYKAAIKKISSDKPEQANSNVLQKQLNSSFGSFWHSAPAAPVAMRAENDSLVHQFFIQTGDLPKAQQLAGEQLLNQRRWGPSNAPQMAEGGAVADDKTAQLVKWPIPAADIPRIKQNIADTAAANSFHGDPSQLALTPISATDPSQGTQWGLTYVDKGGVREPLLNQSGRPVKVDITTGNWDFKAERDNLAAQKVAAAKMQRAQQQKVDEAYGQRMPGPF